MTSRALRQPTRLTDALKDGIINMLQRLVKDAPAVVMRLIEIAFTPNSFVRKLVLVSVLQLAAHVVARLARFRWHLVGLSRPSTVLRHARTHADWLAAQREFALRSPEKPMPEELYRYTQELDKRADGYLKMAEAHDMHGLMFELRSELIRSQAGGSGYSRDGHVAFRKHRGALELISKSQEKVMKALRYIETGSAPGAPSVAERLSFVNETRLAFGRTALMLSGGAALGFKHGGVLQALNREGLLPRIISGSSAGSIAAAAVCVCDAEEVTRRVEGGFLAHVVRTTFFGVKRSESLAELSGTGHDAYPVSRPIKNKNDLSGRMPEQMSRSRRGSVPDLEDLSGGVTSGRLARKMLANEKLLDQSLLVEAVLPLVGELTFLEAYDVSGRILNICVSREDGKVESLMCNYLTTPQMLVWSACVASCAIPGVYEPVELLAKNRKGETVPYFKSGSQRWTDGGLQEDLPQRRLSELFNVNQFIVSQVADLSASSACPPPILLLASL